jgi:hypothetical protein
MSSRIIVCIELTPKAEDRLNEMSDRAGMTQVAMLWHLVERFSEQRPTIQGTIVGHYPGRSTSTSRSTSSSGVSPKTPSKVGWPRIRHGRCDGTSDTEGPGNMYSG